MSTLGVMEANRLPMNPTHRRKDSGEIDVFKAAGYFSGWPEPRRYFGQAHGRKSLDICMKSSFSSQAYNMVDENHLIVQENKTKKKKKSKLPSSPGGKLASFLNSLFSQASSKKKPKSSTSHSVKDEEEISPGGRRRRRSSITHFRGFGIGKSQSYSSSNSNFRTPPAILSQTPSTKKYYERKDMKGYLEENRSTNLLSKYIEKSMPISSFLPSNEVASNVDQRECRKHRVTGDFSCLGKEIRSMYGKVLEKKGVDIEGDRTRAREKKSPKSFARVPDIEMDDGEDSDSSSDLFDLPNYVLGHVYSNGLPVYETTHLENINRSRGVL